MGKRRSKRSLKGFRARRLGDVRHLARCRERFGGPPIEGDFESMVFVDGRALGKQLGLTNAEREQYKVCTIKPFDKTEAELRAIRLAKKRERERLRRRERGAKARASIGKPWLSAGISKSAWYKRRANETERGRHRETERGRHRETERGRHRETERGRHRETERGRHRETERGRHETERGLPSSITPGTLSLPPTFLHPVPTAVLHLAPPEPVAPPNGRQREFATPALPHHTRPAEPNGGSSQSLTDQNCVHGADAGEAPTWKVSKVVGLGRRPWTKPTIVDEALAPGLAVFRDRRAQP